MESGNPTLSWKKRLAKATRKASICVQAAKANYQTGVALQKDLNMPKKWAKQDLMKVYKSTFKALHLGWNSCVYQNSPGADESKTALQKTCELNVSQQCALAAKAATSTQDCFSKRAASRSRELIIPLYSILGPYADYCSQYRRTLTYCSKSSRCPPKQVGAVADDMQGEAE